MKRAAMLYGLLLGLLLGFFWWAPVPPLLVLLFVLALAAQMAVAAIRVWTRTRLAYFTVALAANAVILFLVGIITMRTGHLGSGSTALLLVLSAAASLLLTAVEARSHPKEWAAWRHGVEGRSLLDLMLVRHIPQLR
jgi:hypothetical protein